MDWARYTNPLQARSTLRRGRFMLADDDRPDAPIFDGWTTGSLWNGWATPIFEEPAMRRLAKYPCPGCAGWHRARRTAEGYLFRFYGVDAQGRTEEVSEPQLESPVAFRAPDGRRRVGYDMTGWTFVEVK